MSGQGYNRTPELLQDVTFLLECRVHPERIASQVGHSLAAIEKVLRRAGRSADANLFGTVRGHR